MHAGIIRDALTFSPASSASAGHALLLLKLALDRHYYFERTVASRSKPLASAGNQPALLTPGGWWVLSAAQVGRAVHTAFLWGLMLLIKGRRQAETS